MATKPVTTPRLWATDAVYSSGPFIGDPTKADPGVGIAAEGHRPGSLNPTAAEHENYQQNLLTTWVANWLYLGTSAPLAAAHLQECDAAGRAGILGVDITDPNDETALNVTSANTLAPGSLFTCTTGATAVQAAIGNSAGVGFSAPVGSGAGTGFSSRLTGSIAGASGLAIDADATTAGNGATITHDGSGAGISITATGTGSAIDVIGSALALYGARIIGGGFASLLAEGVGSAFGAIIRSSTTAGSAGLAAALANNTGKAISITTPAGSTTAARGIFASVSGSAAAAEFVSAGYHGAIISGDTTSPTYGALKIEEQDTIPSSFLDNQIARVRPGFGIATHLMESCLLDAGWRGFLSTTGGSAAVLGEYAGPTFQNSVGAWASVLAFTAVNGNAPKTAGRKIILRINISARSGVVATDTTLNLRIYDNTALSYVWTRTGTGTGAGAGYYIAGTAIAGWTQPMTLFVPLTIPAAGPRSWTLEFGNGVATSVYVRDIVVEALGLS